MKTNKFFLIAILLLAGGFCMEMTAQKNLNALVEKCEMRDDIDINIVHNRNRETKETERKVVTLTIRNNPSLVKEFRDALDKDRENAYQVMENKQQGKALQLFYRFEENGMETRCSFTPSDEGSATVSITTRKTATGDITFSTPFSASYETSDGSIYLPVNPQKADE